MGNYAMTVPLPMALDNQQEGFRKLVELGYKEAWSSEANGPDAFMPLVLGAIHAPELRLGTAIVPAFTRGPANGPISCDDSSHCAFALRLGYRIFIKRHS